MHQLLPTLHRVRKDTRLEVLQQYISQLHAILMNHQPTSTTTSQAADADVSLSQQDGEEQLEVAAGGTLHWWCGQGLAAAEHAASTLPSMPGGAATRRRSSSTSSVASRRSSSGGSRASGVPGSKALVVHMTEVVRQQFVVQHGALYRHEGAGEVEKVTSLVDELWLEAVAQLRNCSHW